MVSRLSLPILFGFLVTSGLFYLMQYLISGGKSAVTPDLYGRIVEIVRIKEDRELILPPPRLIEPPIPEVVPEIPRPALTGEKVISIYEIPPLGPVTPPKQTGQIWSDGDYLPVVKVQPQYPRRALSRGLTGWVVVEFTVTAYGNVINPVIVANCAWAQTPVRSPCFDSPNNVFDRTAANAVVKFKYKPRVIDSQAVEVSGVQNRIIFDLAEG